MPFEAASFDAATQLHVGMNVADKGALFAEVRRVLRPGATLAVYDLLKTGEGTIDYPVPWASAASTSALGDLDAYENAMSAAGFDVVTIEDRRDFALGFFAEMKARAEARGGPPPIGVHLIFGRAAPEKLTNMVRAIGSGTIAPTEIVAVAR